MKLRPVILVLSAVAVVLLGLQQVGTYLLIPGGDTGFEAKVLPSRQLQLTSDVGDLVCRINLTVNVATSGTTQWTAVGWQGEPLSVMTQSLGGNRYDVTIEKHPGRATPFQWRAGIPLVLGAGNTIAGAPTVESWAVYASDKESDSSVKAERRWLWTRVSWALLGIVLIGTAVGVLREREEGEAVTARALMRSIIDSIEGDNGSHTRKVRQFLKLVLLQETPRDQALIKVRAGSSLTQRAGFQFSAGKLFRDRINLALAELQRAKEKMS